MSVADDDKHICEGKRSVESSPQEKKEAEELNMTTTSKPDIILGIVEEENVICFIIRFMRGNAKTKLFID